jgi:hypothetical protein
VADVPARIADPHKSPSYPRRVHVRERAHWQEVLRACEAKVAGPRHDLAAMPEGPRRDAAARLVAQMLGARDQVADAARRLPMEVGHLYEEDHQRLEDAIAALDRVLAKWEEQGRG